MSRTRARPRFVNSTEERFGHMLNHLRLRWQYEPHTFVLRTRSDGSPSLAFTPDFYLPDLGYYFEITTLRQKLVTAKNRKARLLAEQRPDVQLRLFYRRDCQEVLRPIRNRKGREALLRRMLPTPSPETLRRAAWLAHLERIGDAAGAVSVLGVRLHLGPEWAGKRVQVWIYKHVLEIDVEGMDVARFPCSYNERTRGLEWVEAGELLQRTGPEQRRLALPELEHPHATRRGARARPRPHPQSSQILLPL